MKTNKYLFFNNKFNEIEYWYRKVLDYLREHKLLWKYDSVNRILDLPNQKWMFVKSDR